MQIRFLDYDSSRVVPNIVVDGSPNDGTVLTLTHWPGILQPEGFAADLSAQMAFLYAERVQSMPAEVVTNNHFDQDGLVSMFALIDPTASSLNRELLIDVAAAGDFGTYQYRDAARASMALSRYADPERSPIASDLTGPYPDQCAVLYERLLPQLVSMALRPHEHRDLWAEEDELLTASELAIQRGAITIENMAELDLAVVDIEEGGRHLSGHRFAGGDQYVGIHPMALNNATPCLRLFQVEGRKYTYTDRYESWVQLQSRRPLARVDLRPLADELTAEDSSTSWSATSPSVLTPQLISSGESSLSRSVVLAKLAAHLNSAEPAWDPYLRVT